MQSSSSELQIDLYMQIDLYNGLKRVIVVVINYVCKLSVS